MAPILLPKPRLATKLLLIDWMEFRGVDRLAIKCSFALQSKNSFGNRLAYPT
jgi:hypothetical protein